MYDLSPKHVKFLTVVLHFISAGDRESILYPKVLLQEPLADFKKALEDFTAKQLINVFTVLIKHPCFNDSIDFCSFTKSSFSTNMINL